MAGVRGQKRVECIKGASVADIIVDLIVQPSTGAQREVGSNGATG